MQTKTNGVISSADWVLDEKELEGLFSNKTKGIIINTPHNPIGKVFTLKELTQIADLAKKWDCLVISDEVYEWIVYEPYKHIRIGIKISVLKYCRAKNEIAKIFEIKL